jgi:hypothetical protein
MGASASYGGKRLPGVDEILSFASSSDLVTGVSVAPPDVRSGKHSDATAGVKGSECTYTIRVKDALLVATAVSKNQIQTVRLQTSDPGAVKKRLIEHLQTR